MCDRHLGKVDESLVRKVPPSFEERCLSLARHTKYALLSIIGKPKRLF